jgi:transcriptional regulator with XRE-family HTH domain
MDGSVRTGLALRTVTLRVTPKPRYQSLATVLRGHRVRLGLSQEDLGDKIKMNAAEISRIESGHRNPTWSTLRRLAAGFELPLAEIVAEVERLEAAEAG